ncbi:MAG: hypothetical protein Q8Q59_07685 [Luteolibacter sp.]|nr:hypothetical protein [Luteolibacter sp.]
MPAILGLLWAFGRGLLLLGIAYLLRHPLLDAIEGAFDIVGITEFAIDVAGTPLTRLLLVAGAGIGYFAVARICSRFFPRHGYGLALACALLCTAAFTWKVGGGAAVVVLVTLILAANWAQLADLKRIGIGSRLLSRVIVIPPAVAEVFFVSRYLDWVGSLLRREAGAALAERPRILPGALIAALALAMLIPGDKLARFERAMRSGPDVRVFATGDFNDIAFDAKENRLLATGHGVPRVLGFNVADLSAAPIEADVETGCAQGFEFDPASGELFIYNGDTRKIVVLDTRTLALKREINAPDISPGDPWIKQCPRSGTLTIASEADEQQGNPFVVFDRASGNVLDKLDLEAGNLLVHPDKPILYANFFRRVCGVVAYDLEKRAILAKTPTDARTDRMAFDPVKRELLMASPVEGRIQCFDALTLAPKGPFKAILGVRVITVDEANDAMFVGSLITGRIALMGLTDRKVKQVWYLGPWLRSIVIAPGTGIAYVSSQKGLYELNYDHRNR